MSELANGRGVNRLAAAARSSGLAAALIMAGALAGCSAISDDVKPDAAYGGTPSAAPAGAAFPDLRDVPQEQPAATPLDERKDVAKGLAADRENALHSDQVLRGGTEAPAPAPVVAQPTPVPALDDDVPAAKDKQSFYDSAPVIPLPEARGGHSDYSKVLPQKEVQTAAKEPEGEPEVMTEDGAAAAAEPAEDTGPEVTAAPTKRVTVKPAVGMP
ncbi:MAG: hypothetical protein CVT81_05005 [Alphaproteobacteria bacterium HGW-Alphaproteobacteria-3]|jgi:hypothetical protein|nr:MAG: hypothetical protein CVT81_05005 [Alphaproteobacteria bacterium HGW-Alphaproteobacteria-3]